MVSQSFHEKQYYVASAITFAAMLAYMVGPEGRVQLPHDIAIIGVGYVFGMAKAERNHRVSGGGNGEATIREDGKEWQTETVRRRFTDMTLKRYAYLLPLFYAWNVAITTSMKWTRLIFPKR
jgi:hypothetical protein